MLKLIKCEFWKLKRKKFIQFVIAAAFLIPIPMTILMMNPDQQKKYSCLAEVYDTTWNFTIGDGVMLLLPCVLGVIAAMLFFMERDSDTYKSLRTIPVTSTQMVLAKIATLFIFGLIFCVSTTLVSMLCGMFVFEVHGALYKLWHTIELGIFITAGTLPLIAIIVLFSRSYIFSILLCVFYSVLSVSTIMLYDVLPKGILHIIPIALTAFWSAGDMSNHIKMNLTEILNLIPTTTQVVITLFFMAVLSIVAIVHLYKKRGE